MRGGDATTDAGPGGPAPSPPVPGGSEPAPLTPAPPALPIPGSLSAAAVISVCAQLGVALLVGAQRLGLEVLVLSTVVVPLVIGPLLGLWRRRPLAALVGINALASGAVILLLAVRSLLAFAT